MRDLNTLVHALSDIADELQTRSAAVDPDKSNEAEQLHDAYAALARRALGLSSDIESHCRRFGLDPYDRRARRLAAVQTAIAGAHANA